MSGEKDNNELLRELLTKQIKSVPQDKKLQYTDLKRICKYIGGSIFDENQCCLWNGYITNVNNTNKGTYINFYFRNKKVALHRLLYINFVGDLGDDEYLKFSCENKGRCCSIAHLRKFQYQKGETQQKVRKASKKQSSNQKQDNMVVNITSSNTCDDPDRLHITFY